MRVVQNRATGGSAAVIDFLTGLPLWVLGLVLNVWLIGFTLVALGILRRWVFPRVRMSSEPALYFSIGVMQAGFMLFGLIAALTAVSVWQRYEQVSGVVSEEATAIAGLYRDFSGYPQPQRGEMQEILRGYTRQIIEEAFPAHRDDRVILKGVEWMDRLQAKLFEFEPATEAQKALHGETIAAYNRVLQARRQRIHAVGSGLPIVVWWALLPGAMGCLVLSLFVPVEDKRHHIVLSACLAGFVAMVLFIIIALDRPFRGAMAITPASYQLVHDQLMAPRK
jgi:hypothetical protein